MLTLTEINNHGEREEKSKVTLLRESACESFELPSHARLIKESVTGTYKLANSLYTNLTEQVYKNLEVLFNMQNQMNSAADYTEE